MNKNVFTFMSCEDEYKESKIVLFGAPYDGTTSFRPGSRFAPVAMRQDSHGIETYSPYLDMDLNDYKICDVGDLDFPFGNAKRILNMIEEKTSLILLDGKIPFVLGGEHLVTLGSVKAMVKKYPNLKIIHIDAHADLRDEYKGELLSHATVLRRIWDLLGDKKIFQFGIRSGTKEEFEFANKHTIMNRFNLKAIGKHLKELDDCPVYVTIDLDILDPSVLPGTGTPEPGGVTYKELIDFIIQLRGLNIVGGDVVELLPHYDDSGISTAAAVKTIREILLVML